MLARLGGQLAGRGPAGVRCASCISQLATHKMSEKSTILTVATFSGWGQRVGTGNWTLLVVLRSRRKAFLSEVVSQAEELLSRMVVYVIGRVGSVKVGESRYLR